MVPKKELGLVRTGTTSVVMLMMALCFAGIPALAMTASVAQAETTTYELFIYVSPVDGIGTTSPPPGTYNYVAGTTAILTAVEIEPWDFQYWAVVDVDQQIVTIYKKPTIKILMDEDHIANAVFGYSGGDGGPTKP